MKRDLALAARGPMQRTLADMRIEHLDAVMAIENAAYAVPWTRGNFIDSLASGCTALCLFDARPAMIGYLVAMRGAGEVHLLNLTSAPRARNCAIRWARSRSSLVGTATGPDRRPSTTKSSRPCR